MFKIEQGVPLPGCRVDDTNRPWPKMQPGDSVFFPAASKDEMQRIRSSVWQFSARAKTTFTSRKVDGGLRVWRVK